MRVWILGLALLLSGCTEKVKVVYREPDIRIGPVYEREDGMRCRDIEIVKENEEKIQVEVKSVCVSRR